MKTADKTSFRELVEESKTIASGEGTRDEKLKRICSLLEENVEIFDWVGFYLVDPDSDRELILGPYVGEETDHTRIPFGKGICGQAANTLKTFVVQDVDKADNYLACSLHVKSEIVVPIMKGEQFVGELDIDSHTKDAMTQDLQTLCEDICKELSAIF